MTLDAQIHDPPEAPPAPRHAREIARERGLSEAELLASRGDGSVRLLRPDWQRLFGALPALGPLKTMTRNDHAVIEKWGVFEDVSLMPFHGQVVGKDIDLRLFPKRWASLLQVSDSSPRGLRESLQIFDQQGDSVLKLYVEPATDRRGFDELVDDLAQRSPVRLPAPTPRASERPRAACEVDVDELRRRWDTMTDTHEFFGLLQHFGIAREQALRLAGTSRAKEVPPDALEQVLNAAVRRELPIMIFVGNRGAIQIHTGLVRRVAKMAGYLNVLDPGFNLHVVGGSTARAWVVRKPTSDGAVTSLELYDAQGENFALLFGERKPGRSEDTRWLELMLEIS